MTVNQQTISSNYFTVDNLNIHYLAAGEGKPVVLVHGWPTSSHLYRNVIMPLAKTRKVIAPDLPGFGQSDKPLDVMYSHNFHAKILGDILTALGVEKTALVVHDIGAPIGLLWAVRNPEKVERLAVLNSLFYPDAASRLFYAYYVSWLRRTLTLISHRETNPVLKLVLLLGHTPVLRRIPFSPFGVARIMRMGVHNKAVMPKQTVEAYESPFRVSGGGRVLTKTFLDLQLDELHEIAQNLSRLQMPVHIIYGANDRLLPTLASEMKRLKNDLPDARLTALPGCGHYLQEDNPGELSRVLSEFLKG